MKKIALVVVIIVVAVTGYLYLTGRFHGFATDGMLVLSEPKAGAVVSSPLVVSGTARGTWYFEASFPVILEDSSGHVIAQKPAQAQGDWMTTGFVPFTVTLTFPKQPAGSHGTLILKRDNPSGLPQNDDARQITIIFK